MPQEIIRRSDRRVNTSAYARQVARWAIDFCAGEERGGSYFAKITARVFTAFMFEGVINHIGMILDESWLNGQGRDNYRGFEAKNKRIRNILGMSNDNQDYRVIADTLDSLQCFRDSFAHPKILVENDVVDIVESPRSDPPLVDWQNSINEIEQVRSEFAIIERYCEEISIAAANKLQHNMKDDSNFCKNYPHLVDCDVEDLVFKMLYMFTFIDSTTSMSELQRL